MERLHVWVVVDREAGFPEISLGDCIEVTATLEHVDHPGLYPISTHGIDVSLTPWKDNPQFSIAHGLSSTELSFLYLEKPEVSTTTVGGYLNWDRYMKYVYMEVPKTRGVVVDTGFIITRDCQRLFIDSKVDVSAFMQKLKEEENKSWNGTRIEWECYRLRVG